MTRATKRNLIKGLAIIIAWVVGVVVSAAVVGRAFLAPQKQVSAETIPSEYVLRAEVVEVDPLEDCVVCEDINGEAWEFYRADDFQQGEFVLLLMNDNATETTYDDEVLDVCLDPFIY